MYAIGNKENKDNDFFVGIVKSIRDGILRCQSVKHNCEIYHNRDKNAVQNMLKIVKSIFNTGKRPDIFCRSS